MKGYIARDYDEDIYFYTLPPKKVNRIWDPDNADEDAFLIPKQLLPLGINPQWEDENPIPVEIFITNSN